MERSKSLATRVTESLLVKNGDLNTNISDSIKEESGFTKNVPYGRIQDYATQLKKFSHESKVNDSFESQNSDEVETEMLESVPHVDSLEEDLNQSFIIKDDQCDTSMKIFGPGGICIPKLAHLRRILPSGNFRVMCITWNIYSRPSSCLSRLANLVKNENADVIAISLQELPPTNINYHHDAVKIFHEPINSSHSVYCWIRKWALLTIILVRTTFVEYIGIPRWQFVSSTVIVKPFRTKGAIIILFKLFQSSFLIIMCHLSNGCIKNRIDDLMKIQNHLELFISQNANSSDAFARKTFNADCIFCMGDLNFRLISRKEIDRIGRSTVSSVFANLNSIFSTVLSDDELKIQMNKGAIFNGFKEVPINFPPTHKFVPKSNDYACSRIPSYRDRILYLDRNSRVHPIKYDVLWEEDLSDHKPTYAEFDVSYNTCRTLNTHEE